MGTGFNVFLVISLIAQAGTPKFRVFYIARFSRCLLMSRDFPSLIAASDDGPPNKIGGVFQESYNGTLENAKLSRTYSMCSLIPNRRPMTSTHGNKTVTFLSYNL